MKTTRTDKLIILVLFILTMMSFNLNAYFNSAGSEAHVYIEGKLAYKIALAEEKEHKIPVENGTATISVKGGKLYITDAPCPRKICIDDSPVFKAGESLICIPNNMIVTIDGESDLDTVTR